MSTVITYYAGLSSPWSYLGHARLRELAKTHHAEIHLRPVDFNAVFAATGGVPLPQRPPERQAYRMQELIRWKAELGIPLTLEPKHFPVPHTTAALMVVAAEQNGANVMDLAEAYMQAVWVNEQDITNEQTLVDIADKMGFDGSALLTKGKSQGIKDIYNRYTQEALQAGVFGAPSYVIDGEVFWGQDRLNFVEKKLKEKGEA